MLKDYAEGDFCRDCQESLTEDNTSTYGGFDTTNYNLANTYGTMGKYHFIKCDDCFEADIDNHLQNQEL